MSLSADQSLSLREKWMLFISASASSDTDFEVRAVGMRTSPSEELGLTARAWTVAPDSWLESPICRLTTSSPLQAFKVTVGRRNLKYPCYMGFTLRAAQSHKHTRTRCLVESATRTALPISCVSRHLCIIEAQSKA